MVAISAGCGNPACNGDDACGAGFICESSTCVKGCDTGDCEKGKYCDGRRCKSGCLSNANCSEDKPACETKTKTCVECINSEDCKKEKAGQVCDAQSCRACENDKECSSGLSCNKEGKCTEGKSTCPPGQVEYPEGSAKCHDSCDTLKCESKNRVCDNKDQAPTCGSCQQGFAENPTTKSCEKACQSKQDCSSTEVCKSNVCGPCKEDTDCGSGFECDAGGCKPIGSACKPDEIEYPENSKTCIPKCETLQCASKNRDCQDPNPSKQCGGCKAGYKSKTPDGNCEKKCSNNTDCSNGQICKNELCSSCQSNADCSNGEQVCQGGQCQACKQDSDCDAGRECDQSTCRDKCPDGYERDTQTRQCYDVCATLNCGSKSRVCDKASTPIQCGACISTHKENPSTQKCEKKCFDNKDCPDATPKCQNELCGPCTQNTDCPSQHSCTNGQCKKIVCANDELIAPSGACVKTCTALNCAGQNRECDNPTTNPKCGACKPTHEEKNSVCVKKACTATCATNQLCEGSCVNQCSKGYAWDPKGNSGNGGCVTATKYCSDLLGTDASTFLEKDSNNNYQVEAIPNPNWNQTSSLSKYIQVCVPKPSFYASPGNGTSVNYGRCDRDQDGWINEEAYRIVQDSEKKVQGKEKPYKKFVRCNLRKVNFVVYRRTGNIHNDGPMEFREDISSRPFEMWETKRNDGDPNATKVSYPDKQDPSLQQSKDFVPAAINSLTKACASGVDLNHNGTPDYQENPKTQVSDSSFQPFLLWSYYTELAYGYFVPSYKFENTTLNNVYVIQERTREIDPTKGGTEVAKGGLALNCNSTSTSSYWRQCILRDDQVCNSAVDQGRSQCWYSKTDPNNSTLKVRTLRRGLPSLFKCVKFPESTTSTKTYFDTSNFGLAKNYTRTICSLSTSAQLDQGKASQRTDNIFSCTANIASTDKPKRDDVGWTCRTYKNHKSKSTDSSTDYIAGCVQECTDNEYNSSKPNDSLLPCPGTREIGDRLCSTNTSNYGQGTCGWFLHYGHLTAVGCSGSTGCSPVATGGTYQLFDGSFTGATASFDPAQAGSTATSACVGSKSTSGPALCLEGGFSSEGN
ncbi:MAG: hypothetical protein EP343_11260 [Deltaproteobacteria bacterium]|nr:MAG: hypothetical protein EP343_11260 [Deltaproteobacteria bacterium]